MDASLDTLLFYRGRRSLLLNHNYVSTDVEILLKSVKNAEKGKTDTREKLQEDLENEE